MNTDNNNNNNNEFNIDNDNNNNKHTTHTRTHNFLLFDEKKIHKTHSKCVAKKRRPIK